MNINIDSNLINFVNEQAVLDNVTPEVWVERKANAAIKRVLKDNLIADISSNPIESIVRFDAAVKTVKTEIETEIAAEIANGIVPQADVDILL